jgi:hypothetical protein
MGIGGTDPDPSAISPDTESSDLQLIKHVILTDIDGNVVAQGELNVIICEGEKMLIKINNPIIASAENVDTVGSILLGTTRRQYGVIVSQSAAVPDSLWKRDRSS